MTAEERPPPARRPPAITRPAAAEDTYLSAERRRAMRALLRSPLLRAGTTDDDDFRLVRRHREELTRTFAEAFGYRLVVEPRAARLFKAGLGRDATRGLRRRSGAAFTPRTYALLCLTLAALTRAKDQLMVDEIVAEVSSAAADAGMSVDLDKITDRRALHAALTALVEMGVLRERDADGGGLARWAEDRRARALLDVSRDQLRLVASVPLAGAASPDDLIDRAAVPSAAGGARVAIRRRLIESPVMSVTDLTDEQAEWWGKNRIREQERLEDLVGLELELRAEGALAVDPEGELTDEEFPGIGTLRRFALLALEGLVEKARDAGATAASLPDRVWWALPSTVLDHVVDGLATRYRAALTQAYQVENSSLSQDIRSLLCGTGLLRNGPDGTIELHAAAARFAPMPEVSSAHVLSLFDDVPEDAP